MRLLVYFLTFVIGSIAAGGFSPDTNRPCKRENESGSARLFAEDLRFSELTESEIAAMLTAAQPQVNDRTSGNAELFRK